MWLPAILAIVIPSAVIILALCKAAGQADIKQEQWIRERKREEEAYRWCTDECLYCEQNDWCKFSEVKKEERV